MLLQTAYPTPMTDYVLALLGYFVSSLFSLSFFVGFSALATSYIIKKARSEISLHNPTGNDAV